MLLRLLSEDLKVPDQFLRPSCPSSVAWEGGSRRWVSLETALWLDRAVPKKEEMAGSKLYKQESTALPLEVRLDSDRLEGTRMNLNEKKLSSIDLTARGWHLWIRGQLRKYLWVEIMKVIFVKKKSNTKSKALTLKKKHPLKWWPCFLH